MADGPTITTIAERAGVSIASVSRVLNGLPTRQETVRKVMAAADELGYVPQRRGQSLKSSRTHQVAFAMADIGNPAYLAMVREIQPVLKAAGYRLVLHSTDAVADDEIDVLRQPRRALRRRADHEPAARHRDAPADARRRRAPVVVIGSVPEGTPVDNVRATRAPACGSPSTTCTRSAAAGSACQRPARHRARRRPRRRVRRRAGGARPAVRPEAGGDRRLLPRGGRVARWRRCCGPCPTSTR